VCPHEAAGVVVDDHGQVPMAFADRDLIEPEPRESREQVASLLGLRGDALADPPDGPPRDPHQMTDRGLAGVDRQPRDRVFEAAREPGVVPGPRHRGDDYSVLYALDAGRVGLQEADRRAEIKRSPSPAPLAEVIPRAAAPAVRAATPLARARPDRDHDRVVLAELDALDDRHVNPNNRAHARMPTLCLRTPPTAPFQGS